MRKLARYLGLALAILIVAAPIASAQMREFTGRVDTINKKKMIVDNRKGDKVPFNRVDETAVEGEKDDWGKIKKKDWVTVSWKFMDKPRKAYKVIVLPPKADEDE